MNKFSKKHLSFALGILVLSGLSYARNPLSPHRVPIRVVDSDYFPMTWAEFQKSGIDVKSPVLFRGAALSWPSMKRWNLETLRQHFGAREVQVALDEDFIFGRHAMSFGDHLTDITRNPERSGYLYISDRHLNKTGRQHPPILEDIYEGTRFPQSYTDCTLFVGGKTKSPAHAHEGVFFAQMIGTKKAYLVPPDARSYLYSLGEADGDSPVNLAHVDLKKYPLLSHVTIFETDVRPGDVLYVPDYWFHAFHATETPALSMACGNPDSR